MLPVLLRRRGRRVSGNLYQLKTAARPGQYVEINGPYDRFGQVMALRESGFHLIRGIGDAKPAGPVWPLLDQDKEKTSSLSSSHESTIHVG